MTAGRIKNLLKPELITADTLLVLGNALYFNGTRDEKFDPFYTKTDIFHLTNGH